jgi:hypothetical protein
MLFKNKTNKEKNEVILTCNCYCGESMRVVLKQNYDFDNEQDCAYMTYLNVSNMSFFKDRMKYIWKLIKGDDICVSDIVLSKDDVREYSKILNKFVKDMDKGKDKK